MTDGVRQEELALDVRTFWSLIGQRATGATVVTARDERGPAGFLGLSATHLCSDPPMLLVSIDGKTSALATILAAGHFAINILPREQAALADLFGGRGGVTGAGRFETTAWTRLTTGAPILPDALAALDCRLEETILRHGTTIAIGRIVDFARNPDAAPLVAFRGGFLP